MINAVPGDTADGNRQVRLADIKKRILDRIEQTEPLCKELLSNWPGWDQAYGRFTSWHVINGEILESLGLSQSILKSYNNYLIHEWQIINVEDAKVVLRDLIVTKANMLREIIKNIEILIPQTSENDNKNAGNSPSESPENINEAKAANNASEQGGKLKVIRADTAKNPSDRIEEKFEEALKWSHDFHKYVTLNDWSQENQHEIERQLSFCFTTLVALCRGYLSGIYEAIEVPEAFQVEAVRVASLATAKQWDGPAIEVNFNNLANDTWRVIQEIEKTKAWYQSLPNEKKSEKLKRIGDGTGLPAWPEFKTKKRQVRTAPPPAPSRHHDPLPPDWPTMTANIVQGLKVELGKGAAKRDSVFRDFRESLYGILTRNKALFASAIDAMNAGIGEISRSENANPCDITLQSHPDFEVKILADHKNTRFSTWAPYSSDPDANRLSQPIHKNDFEKWILEVRSLIDRVKLVDSQKNNPVWQKAASNLASLPDAIKVNDNDNITKETKDKLAQIGNELWLELCRLEELGLPLEISPHEVNAKNSHDNESVSSTNYPEPAKPGNDNLETAVSVDKDGKYLFPLRKYTPDKLVVEILSNDRIRFKIKDTDQEVEGVYSKFPISLSLYSFIKEIAQKERATATHDDMKNFRKKLKYTLKMRSNDSRVLFNPGGSNPDHPSIFATWYTATFECKIPDTEKD